MSIKLLALGGVGIDEIVGKILTDVSDKSKVPARATEGYAIAAGIKQILDGDPAAGVNQVAAAVLGNEASLEPYQQQAITNLMNLANQELTLLQGTALGQLVGLKDKSIADAILAEVEAVCVEEGATVPSAPAAATAAA